MSLKLNLGAGALWSKAGWTTVDHNLRKPSVAWSIPLADGSCSIVFSSHMIEHIPHYKVEKVLCEVNRVLEVGGLLRILTPDLERLAKAYVEHDLDFFQGALKEDESIRTDLGIGGSFMNFIVSPGVDSMLLSKHFTEVIGGYAHLYCYDFEMLETLLIKHGFGNIIRSDFCQSANAELREPRRVEKTPERRQGVTVYRERVTGFDRDPLTSLFVEAVKISDINYTDYQDANAPSASNFNYYGLGVTRGSSRLRCVSISFVSRVVSLVEGAGTPLVRFWRRLHRPSTKRKTTG